MKLFIKLFILQTRKILVKIDLSKRSAENLMKQTFHSLLILGIIFLIAASNTKTSANEFQLICGSWKGSLTYLDYTSGKPYTMPANLEIARIGTSNNFLFKQSYPNEPNANSTDTLQISAEGTSIDNERIKSNILLNSGIREITTEYKDVDGNNHKPASIRHIYALGKTTFSIKKFVKFDTDTSFFLRHEYAYKR